MTIKDRSVKDRNVSLGFGGKKAKSNVLNLLGGLSHNSDISFDKENAQKLIDWLNTNIIGVK